MDPFSEKSTSKSKSKSSPTSKTKYVNRHDRSELKRPAGQKLKEMQKEESDSMWKGVDFMVDMNGFPMKQSVYEGLFNNNIADYKMVDGKLIRADLHEIQLRRQKVFCLDDDLELSADGTTVVIRRSDSFSDSGDLEPERYVLRPLSPVFYAPGGEVLSGDGYEESQVESETGESPSKKRKIRTDKQIYECSNVGHDVRRKSVFADAIHKEKHEETCYSSPANCCLLCKRKLNLKYGEGYMILLCRCYPYCDECVASYTTPPDPDAKYDWYSMYLQYRERIFDDSQCVLLLPLISRGVKIVINLHIFCQISRKSYSFDVIVLQMCRFYRLYLLEAL